jgi:hypothetical protein
MKPEKTWKLVATEDKRMKWPGGGHASPRRIEQTNQIIVSTAEKSTAMPTAGIC